MRCWFYQEDILNFRPRERFITGAALIKRWKKQPHIQPPEDFIQGLVYDSRLTDFHPVTRFTKWSDESYVPSKETALFQLSEVKEIEKVYFNKDNYSETNKDDWFTESEAKTTKRRDTQINAIVQQAKTFGYNSLSIPYGGKTKIKNECLKNTNLFTEAGFDHAWRKARKDSLVEVENIDSYRSKPA